MKNNLQIVPWSRCIPWKKSAKLEFLYGPMYLQLDDYPPYYDLNMTFLRQTLTKTWDVVINIKIILKRSSAWSPSATTILPSPRMPQAWGGRVRALSSGRHRCHPRGSRTHRECDRRPQVIHINGPRRRQAHFNHCHTNGVGGKIIPLWHL